MSTFTINFGPALNRRCGPCTLCCTLVPVKELRKAANTKCTHQFSGGCRIYANRPISCQFWNCAWLTDETTLHLRRPDRSRYVIDTVPDTITAEEGGRRWQMQVAVVWIDPAHPDAHRDPALRKWLEERNVPMLVRNGNRSATFVAPPALVAGHKDWLEQKSELAPKDDHLDWAVGSS